MRTALCLYNRSGLVRNREKYGQPGDRKEHGEIHWNGKLQVAQDWWCLKDTDYLKKEKERKRKRK